MAFSRNGFYRISNGLNDDTVVLYGYQTSDSIATITASGYFNDAPEVGGDDVILAVASDGARILVTSLSGSTINTALFDDGSVADGSVTTAKLADNAVTLAKTATGLCSAFSTVHTTVGGSSTETVTATGVNVGAVVHATINTSGASPVTVSRASCTSANQITVVFSADPSTDHKINITAFNVS